MRLPFLQVAQEGFAKARLLAGALGVDRHRTASLLWDLWALSLELGPSDSAPTGVLPGPDADRCLARALEWRRDPTALVDGLVRFGLVERLEDGGLRVKGTDRYADAFEGPERRSAHAKAAADARWSKARADAQPMPGHAPSTCPTDAQRCQDVDVDVDVEEKEDTHTRAALPPESVSTETVELAAPAPRDEFPPLSPRELSLAPPPEPAPTAVKRLQDAWNDAAGPAGLPQWRETSTARAKAAKARLRERPDFDGPGGWNAVIAHIVASPFCRGESQSGWRAGPDFLLRPDTAAKALEGTYDRGTGPPKRLDKGTVRPEDIDYSPEAVEAGRLLF